jgi:hypothetical protein
LIDPGKKMIYISQITAQPVNSAAPKSVQIDTVYTIGFGFITALFAAIIASVITTYRLTKRQTKSNVFESKLEELEDLKVENAILNTIAGSENRLRAEMKSSHDNLRAEIKSGFDELGRKIQDISDKMVSRFETDEEKIHKLDIRVLIIESKE